MKQALHDFCILSDLVGGSLFICMNGVGFEKVNFSNSDERAGLFGFIPEGVHNLKSFEWQVRMTTDP